MDTFIRERMRQMVMVDYFTLDQNDRIRYLNHKKRAGELTWSNNIRDLLCSAGVEDFVLLIGGPKAPVLLEEEPLILAYKGLVNWSASPKHKPEWRLVSRQQVIRRIIKIGGQRAKSVLTSRLCNLEACATDEIRKALIREYLL